ncbi:hypothetical protein YC2023_069911 [Brassica napus]
MALYVLLHPVKTASSLLSPLPMSLHHQNFGEEAIIDIFSRSNSTPKIVFYKVTNEAFLWKITKGNLKRTEHMVNHLVAHTSQSTNHSKRLIKEMMDD